MTLQSGEIGILAPGIVRDAPLPRRWRRRGAFTGLADADEADLLAHAFRLGDSDMATAPLHYLGMTGRDPGGYCLFAYPVYLHARREQLILMTGPEFELSDEEAQSVLEVLRAHFPEWRIERTTDAMWFIILDQDPDLETTSLQHALGENINDHLPRGRDAMAWHRNLNELQMLLFDCDVNREREQAGRPTVNSFWFWGGGRLPAVHEPFWRRVVTNNPVARGIGHQAGMDTQWVTGAPVVDVVGDPAPEDPGTLWIVSPPGDSDAAAPVVASEQWQALKTALRSGRLDRLILIEPGHGELIIDRRAATSWWPW